MLYFCDDIYFIFRYFAKPGLYMSGSSSFCNNAYFWNSKVPASLGMIICFVTNLGVLLLCFLKFGIFALGLLNFELEASNCSVTEVFSSILELVNFDVSGVNFSFLSVFFKMVFSSRENRLKFSGEMTALSFSIGDIWCYWVTSIRSIYGEKNRYLLSRFGSFRTYLVSSGVARGENFSAVSCIFLKKSFWVIFSTSLPMFDTWRRRLMLSVWNCASVLPMKSW